MNSKRLSRRDFLRMGALTAAGAALAGCGQPAAEVIKEQVEVTRIVEKEGETMVETVEVEKVVTEEVIVEVEVEATPEPVTRQGGWLDTIIVVEEPSSDAAVTRLEVGDLDVYAYNIS